MKALETKNEDIEIGGNVGKSVDFSVKIDGHIFKLMTDGLYSQKVPSVVREILANAIDAQIKSGRNTAVRVSLPTSFNRTFRVRDFGDGMTAEFAETLYTQLGHSTKRDDNTQTGYFGMGSKSPFTIVDQFTVTLFDGSVKRIYSAYKKPDGVPAFMLGSVSPSSEPSGVEVSLATPQHLVPEFEAAVKATAFAYFDKNISFNRDFGSGEQPLDWAQKSFHKVADGVYTLREKRDAYSYQRAQSGAMFIRQGFAVYPLEIEQITRHGQFPAGLQTVMRKLTARNTKVYFDAPLGTFNVTASREKIQYDTPSVDNLKVLIPGLLKQTVEQLAAQMKGVVTYRDAMAKLYTEAVKEFSTDEIGKPVARPNIDEIIRAAKDNFEIFKDEVQANGRALHPTGVPPGLLMKASVHERDVMASAKISSSAFHVYHDNSKLIHSVSFSRHETTVVELGDLLYVVPAVVKHWQDRVADHALSVVKKLLPANYDGTYKITLHVVRCNRADAADAAKKFLTLADNTVYTVYTENDLPAYVPSPNSISATTKRTYSKSAVYTVKRSGPSYNWAWASDKVEADLGEDALYVTRVGITSKITMGNADLCQTVKNHASPWAANGNYVFNTVCENYNFFQIVHAAIDCGILKADTPIYRVTERQRDKMIAEADDCNWIDFAEDVIPKLLTKLDAVHAAQKQSVAAAAIKDRQKPRWVATMVEELRDLKRATEDIVEGGSFAEATKKFLKEAEVFGNALFELPDLMKSDAFVLMVLPTLYSDGTGPFKDQHADLTKLGAIRSAAKKAFASIPDMTTPKVPKSYDKLYTELNDQFALLGEINYIRPWMGRHVLRCLTATVADASVASVAAKNYPEIEPMLKVVRDYVAAIIDEFTVQQTKNKGSN